MWPRLGKITALVSLLATFLGFVYQLQQYRKECPDLPWLTCEIQVLLPDLAKILFPDPPKVPFSNTAKTEWEREVQFTESEERIEDFINKYQEGPYVTLARKRLEVAGAWTAIKNTPLSKNEWVAA